MRESTVWMEIKNIMVHLTIPNLQSFFEEQVTPHLASLYPTAYGILKNKEDAEDAVQETLRRAWEDILKRNSEERLETLLNAGAWLATILRHYCFNELKRPARKRNAPL